MIFIYTSDDLDFEKAIQASEETFAVEKEKQDFAKAIKESEEIFTEQKKQQQKYQQELKDAIEASKKTASEEQKNSNEEKEKVITKENLLIADFGDGNSLILDFGDNTKDIIFWENTKDIIDDIKLRFDGQPAVTQEELEKELLFIQLLNNVKQGTLTPAETEKIWLFFINFVNWAYAHEELIIQKKITLYQQMQKDKQKILQAKKNKIEMAKAKQTLLSKIQDLQLKKNNQFNQLFDKFNPFNEASQNDEIKQIKKECDQKKIKIKNLNKKYKQYTLLQREMEDIKTEILYLTEEKQLIREIRDIQPEQQIKFPRRKHLLFKANKINQFCILMQSKIQKYQMEKYHTTLFPIIISILNNKERDYGRTIKNIQDKIQQENLEELSEQDLNKQIQNKNTTKHKKKHHKKPNKEEEKNN